MDTNLELIDVKEIHVGPETQTRATTSTATVEQYAEAMRSGATFPPPVVFIDSANAESLVYLADGFHRLLAYQSLGVTSVACDVREGGLREAIKFALAANVRHGLPLSLADRRRKMQIILADEEWKRLSARCMAEMCGLSVPTVSKILEDVELPATFKDARGRTHVRKKKAKKRKAEPATEQVRPAEPEAEKDSAPDVVLDEVGKEVPVELVPIFTQRAIFNELGRDIDSIRKDVDALSKGAAGHYLSVHLPGIDRELKAARDALIATAPYALHKAKAGSRHPDWVSSGAYKSLGLSESEEPVPF